MRKIFLTSISIITLVRKPLSRVVEAFPGCAGTENLDFQQIQGNPPNPEPALATFSDLDSQRKIDLTSPSGGVRRQTGYLDILA